MTSSGGQNLFYVKLIVCVSGIYFFFLTWGVMQERLATTLYASAIHPASPPAKFRSFLLVTLTQAAFSALVALVSLRLHHLPIGLPAAPLRWGYTRVALTGCLAAPFGYAALKHINYPTMVLGKSCKLLPLMLLNVLLHRRRFQAYKYVTVGLITTGVAGFMFFEKSAETVSTKSNSVYGLSLLLVNLLLDGATNSWQDELFLKYRIRSHHMMFFMNALSTLFTLSFLVVTNPFTGELSTGIQFIKEHPLVLRDILMFCGCGAMGQVFIFATIEHFGSLILVTVTVTRKLFTILLSLFWFNHRLNPAQWASVSLVFVALVIESLFKPSGHHHHPQLKAEPIGKSE